MVDLRFRMLHYDEMSFSVLVIQLDVVPPFGNSTPPNLARIGSSKFGFRLKSKIILA